jgi:hypothetical protein
MPFVSLVPFQDIDPAFQDIMRTYDREYGCSEFHALLQVRLRASGRNEVLRRMRRQTSSRLLALRRGECACREVLR